MAKGYRGMGTLGEIYKRPHYIVSVPITGDDGYIIGYVFAASPADELSQFLVDVLRMFAIAAVVVGGTSMSGGRGSVVGSVLGMLILAVMNNLLNLIGVPPFLREAFKGIIVIGAVLLQKKEKAS